MKGDWREKKSSQLLGIPDQNLVFTTCCSGQDEKCWYPAPFWKTPQLWAGSWGRRKPCVLGCTHLKCCFHHAELGWGWWGSRLWFKCYIFLQFVPSFSRLSEYFFFCMPLRSFPENLKGQGFKQQFLQVFLGSRTTELLTLPCQKRNSHMHS